jgi:hypothetical protein
MSDLSQLKATVQLIEAKFPDSILGQDLTPIKTGAVTLFNAINHLDQRITALEKHV